MTPRKSSGLTAGTGLWIVAFVLTSALLTWLAYGNWKSREAAYLYQHAQAVTLTYHSSVGAHAMATGILVDELIRQPLILDTFARGMAGDPAARGQLYRMLAPTYDRLVRRGIRQLQFHTATAHSYLRFHQPDRHGDPLMDVRPSLRIANLEKRAVAGFEMGHVISGFRYVFPLAAGDRHLGSVEASVTFQQIRTHMAQNDPGREYVFVQRRDRIEATVFKESGRLYAPWGVNAAYVEEDPKRELPGAAPPPPAVVAMIDAALAGDARVASGMAAGATFTLPAFMDDMQWAVSFVPVRDVAGEQAAYVVAYTPAPLLVSLRQDFIWLASLSNLALAAILFLVFRLWRSRVQHARLAGRLQAITDTMADGLYVTDGESNLVFVNPAFTELLAYPANEVLGNCGHCLFHAHDHNGGQTPPDQCPITKETRQGHVYRGEEVFRARTGELRDMEVVSQPVRDAAGKLTGSSVTAFRDITERKRLNDELIRYRDHLEELVLARTAELVEAKVAADAANRAKSAFLANMSHELRTPMNGVMGMLELASRRMIDPKGLDQLGKAKGAADRLLALLNDILDISKIEAERMVLEDHPLQLGSVLDHLSSVLGHKAAEKGLTLAIDLPDALGRLPLQGDPLRLGQILLNLAGNAIKFTDHGSVTLRVRADTETPEAVQVRFEIIDTGIGIDPAAQARLFTAFEQADSSMTRQYGGTGLGLAISKRLAHLMGGEIGVHSTPGTGSTFWFTVRLARRAEHAAPPAPTSGTEDAETRLRRNFAGARILLVEDEPVSREVARSVLDDAGLSVDLAEDGQQALDLARQNRYDLILMDMQMPNLNGVDATKAIRAESLNRATPILAMTANAFDEDRQACLEAGMNEHITKPVDPDRLHETLLKWLPDVTP